MATVELRAGPLERSAEEERTLLPGAGVTVLFLMVVTAAMLFTTFTASYLVRRTSPDWVPVAVPSVVGWSTALLVLSSVTMEAARRGGRGWLRATAVLGVLFAAGQVVAWRELAQGGAFLASSPHASFIYMLTAVHGAHLLAGLAVLAAAMARPAITGIAAAWWHVVGALWLWVFFVLTQL